VLVPCVVMVVAIGKMSKTQRRSSQGRGEVEERSVCHPLAKVCIIASRVEIELDAESSKEVFMILHRVRASPGLTLAQPDWSLTPDQGQLRAARAIIANASAPFFATPLSTNQQPIIIPVRPMPPRQWTAEICPRVRSMNVRTPVQRRGSNLGRCAF